VAAAEQGVKVRELTRDQGWTLLDKQARRYLGMSAEEFVRRWDLGDFAQDDRYEVQRVAMLLPFGR
jgi:hypothetical protein